MPRLTVKEIKQFLKQSNIDTQMLSNLERDDRKGVQMLVSKYKLNLAQNKKKQSAFNSRLQFEQIFWAQNQLVAGIDEVGRGPLAGPVVAAAVVLDDHFNLLDVHDSKQLSFKKRQTLVPQIKDQVLAYAFGVVSAEQIDELNIYQAAKLAMTQAYQNLDWDVQGLLIDAMELELTIDQTSLIKGDDRSISIGAASILAKDYRDRLMMEYDLIYPGYDFKNNAGYGTAKHLAGLETHGVTPIHRKTFAPVKKHLN
ncbi:ribonuclease HII [Weissella coleopterorum]|uniref:Ribonuclease HII n=1 Tax=Weissella coleopterorum TaxID=2714949 RepID=A0A6G8B043_9LACO|nr:ribonuclease HII [Weissella coleopterorum]QIL50600.1 ribonuclease HII [Weissella coleopterorum]